MQAAGGDCDSWREAHAAYRQHLYIQGRQKGLNPEGRPIRRGFLFISRKGPDSNSPAEIRHEHFQALISAHFVCPCPAG